MSRVLTAPESPKVIYEVQLQIGDFTVEDSTLSQVLCALAVGVCGFERRRPQ
jgi:hypothetical protein